MNTDQLESVMIMLLLKSRRRPKERNEMRNVVLSRAGSGRSAVRARRRPISKRSRGMQIILKKFYQREKLGI
jgi:hypothetical protein